MTTWSTPTSSSCCRGRSSGQEPGGDGGERDEGGRADHPAEEVRERGLVTLVGDQDQQRHHDGDRAHGSGRPDRKQLRQCLPHQRCSSASRVLRRVLPQQLLLGLLAREAEVDEDGAQQDRDPTGGVGPVVALQEGRLRRGRDLVGVLRVLLGDLLGSRERLRELDSTWGVTLLASEELPIADGTRWRNPRSAARRRRTAGSPRRGRAAVRRPRGHAGPANGDRPVSEWEAGVPASPTPVPMRA